MGRPGLEPVAVVPTQHTPTADIVAIDQLMNAPTRPMGVIFGSDDMAMAAMHHLSEQGLILPRDLSVIGFDGQVFRTFTSPPLTTVRRDGYQRGRAAATLLIRLLGEDIGEPEVLDVPQLSHP